MTNESFMKNDDCCRKDARLTFGEVFLDVVRMSVGRGRLKVKNCILIKVMKQGRVSVGSSGKHLLSVMIFSHCVQSLYLFYVFQSLPVSHQTRER